MYKNNIVLLSTVAVSLLASLDPSIADNPCWQWKIAGIAWYAAQSNGTTTQIVLNQNGTSLTGQGMYCNSGWGAGGWDEQKGQCRGGPIRGQIDGSIQGNVIQFEVYWANTSVGVYTGTIGPTGRIDGATYDKVNPSHKATWYSDIRMECAFSASTAGQIGKVIHETTQTPAETKSGKVLGRVPTTSPAPARTICEAARDARARNSPAAPGLEAQCLASQGPGKVLGRVPTTGSTTQRSICDAARDARARNSPAAPGLEAQCRASQQATQQNPSGTPEAQKSPGVPEAQKSPGVPEAQKSPGTLDLPVKKSASNICYSPGAADYNQITSFTPYKTIDECLKSGGRLASNVPSGPKSPDKNNLPGQASQNAPPGKPGKQKP